MIHMKGNMLKYGVFSYTRRNTNISRSTIKQSEEIIDVISIRIFKNTDSAETVFNSQHMD